jgi:putative tryptophan/tyrosine transport system substrate-binding protein
MRRRELILLLGGAVTAAHALRAQQKAMPVLGYLSGGSSGSLGSYASAFRERLSEAGYLEGQNF